MFYFFITINPSVIEINEIYPYSLFYYFLLLIVDEIEIPVLFYYP